jgi:hypothetical protein
MQFVMSNIQNAIPRSENGTKRKIVTISDESIKFRFFFFIVKADLSSAFLGNNVFQFHKT